MLGCFFIATIISQHLGVKEVCACEIGSKGECFLEHHSGTFHVAFLLGHSSDVDPTVWIFRINLRDFLEPGGSAFQISLQQWADPVIVPARPTCCLEFYLGLRR